MGMNKSTLKTAQSSQNQGMEVMGKELKNGLLWKKYVISTDLIVVVEKTSKMVYMGA